jgi:hypothetical protein
MKERLKKAQKLRNEGLEYHKMPARSTQPSIGGGRRNTLRERRLTMASRTVQRTRIKGLVMKRKWETTAPFEPELTEEEEKAALFLARLAIEPTVNAAMVIGGFDQHLGNLQTNALVRRLSQSVNLVGANDMRQCEAMLVGQALALQAIFTNMAQRASLNLGQRMEEAERWMRIALKAQNQCRMTLETLAALKNPRVVVAQQTNIANGPQQVNNGPPNPGDAKDAYSHTDKHEPEQNELLEVSNGERLDAGTAGATGGSNPEMVPVGSLDRSADG